MPNQNPLTPISVEELQERVIPENREMIARSQFQGAANHLLESVERSLLTIQEKDAEIERLEAFCDAMHLTDEAYIFEIVPPCQINDEKSVISLLTNQSDTTKEMP